MKGYEHDLKVIKKFLSEILSDCLIIANKISLAVKKKKKENL